jgi:hypothetical protein
MLKGAMGRWTSLCAGFLAAWCLASRLSAADADLPTANELLGMLPVQWIPKCAEIHRGLLKLDPIPR